MASVGLLCFFIFSVYGILAIQLWTGVTHQRCYRDMPNSFGQEAYYNFDDDANGGYICTNADDLGQGGYSSCRGIEDDDGNSYPHCLRAEGFDMDVLPTGEAKN